MVFHLLPYSDSTDSSVCAYYTTRKSKIVLTRMKGHLSKL